MKKHYFLWTLLLLALFLPSCGGGGGGGGGSDSGTISIGITDARPAIDSGITKVVVVIDEISVHRSGGDWETLQLAESPFTIDLLQYSDGQSTSLVPAVSIASGKYTQIRLGVASCTVTDDTGDHAATIPSGNLKTNKNFEFTVRGGGAVALTVDFDLSQSIVKIGAGAYQLKPVLHLVEAAEAATITGKLAFFHADQATVTVRDGVTDEIYTEIIVEMDAGNPSATVFSIFWLPPNEKYKVHITASGQPVYSETVEAASLPTGAVFHLYSNQSITSGWL